MRARFGKIMTHATILSFQRRHQAGAYRPDGRQIITVAPADPPDCVSGLRLVHCSGCHRLRLLNGLQDLIFLRFLALNLVGPREGRILIATGGNLPGQVNNHQGDLGPVFLDTVSGLFGSEWRAT